MTDDDRLLDDLAALDPALTDPAPSSGSPRAHEILERAMTTADTDAERNPSDRLDEPAERSDPHRTRRIGRRLVAAAAAAAAVLVVVGVVVVLEPDRDPTPAAALTQAAERTEEEQTLRSDYRWVDEDGETRILRTDHDGDDLRRTYLTVGPDGAAVATGRSTVYIGDREWEIDGDEVMPIPDPDGHNAPYAQSSAAIVGAAVSETTVTELGEQDVRGTPATHYRIDLDAAAIGRLEDLPTNQRSAFELEYPSNIRRLDVWIADGHLRRIQVIQDYEAADSPGTTVEFYDFGADITIEPPT